jgi:hypothetical protein
MYNTYKAAMNVALLALKLQHSSKVRQSENLSRSERGRFGALKSDSTHHFF